MDNPTAKPIRGTIPRPHPMKFEVYIPTSYHHLVLGSALFQDKSTTSNGLSLCPLSKSEKDIR